MKFEVKLRLDATFLEQTLKKVGMLDGEFDLRLLEAMEHGVDLFRLVLKKDDILSGVQFSARFVPTEFLLGLLHGAGVKPEAMVAPERWYVPGGKMLFTVHLPADKPHLRPHLEAIASEDGWRVLYPATAEDGEKAIVAFDLQHLTPPSEAA